jgi:hypothetical protein
VRNACRLKASESKEIAISREALLNGGDHMWDRCTEWLRCGIGFRLAQTLVAALVGLGILVLLISLLTDAYSWQAGIVGLVVLWVLAFALRVFVVTSEE